MVFIWSLVTCLSAWKHTEWVNINNFRLIVWLSGWLIDLLFFCGSGGSCEETQNHHQDCRRCLQGGRTQSFLSEIRLRLVPVTSSHSSESSLLFISISQKEIWHHRATHAAGITVTPNSTALVLQWRCKLDGGRRDEVFWYDAQRSGDQARNTEMRVDKRRWRGKGRFWDEQE